MAQTLSALTYEDIELFCQQALQEGASVTLESLLTEFPNDPIDAVAYFHQWRQHQLNQSLADSPQGSELKAEIPPTITQILQQEIAKLQASQVKDQQNLLAQQRDIEKFLIDKSRELQANLASQSKFVDESHRQLEQQAKEFQEELKKLTNDYTQEINTLKQQHQQSLIAQQQAHQSAIENVINENKAQLTHLNDQVERLTEQNKQLKAKAQEYLSSHQQLNDLHTKAIQLEQQLAEEKATQDQSTLAAKLQYQESLNALRDAHQRELKELNAIHQNELANILSEKETTIQKVNRQLNQALAENQHLKTQLVATQDKASNQKNRHINTSNDAANQDDRNAKWQATLDQANAKISLLEQQLSQQEVGAKEESDANALEKAERMITILRNENNKLANQLAQIKTNSVATIERLTSKSDQAVSRIKELESQLDLEVQTNSSAKEERVKLKEQLELMKYNQASTFERLTNNAEQAKAKIQALEQKLANLNR
ncbi:hypothetical protein [Thalassotalea ganghwensis]